MEAGYLWLNSIFLCLDWFIRQSQMVSAAQVDILKQLTFGLVMAAYLQFFFLILTFNSACVWVFFTMSVPSKLTAFQTFRLLIWFVWGRFCFLKNSLIYLQSTLCRKTLFFTNNWRTFQTCRQLLEKKLPFLCLAAMLFCATTPAVACPCILIFALLMLSYFIGNRPLEVLSEGRYKL